jgi:RNA polymerase sigma factor (sigma-70 family)
MLVAKHPPAPGLRVDEVGELYRVLSRRLEQIVRFDVRAPEAVIEDACQFAWSRLIVRAAEVRREAVLSWLVRTAVHEALKLVRRANRCLSLDAALEHGGEGAVLRTCPPPVELVEQRERLAAVRELPARQQQLLWLHGLGLSYAEIALHTGWTQRTVERQLLRGRQRIRAAGAGES